jgi:hypothetical protein
MKYFNACVTVLMLLASTITGCQKDDNFLVKQEAFSVITSGYNGSNSELGITIDTLTLYPIAASGNFKRTDKYTFGEGQQSVKLVINETETGKLVFEKEVKRGEYSVTIELIYVNGKLIEKPVPPVDNPAGFRLASYLFIPRISNYSGKIDVAYCKLSQVVLNGQLVTESDEELARITLTPYEFSPFLQAPNFTSGRNEINGKVYFINQDLKLYKSGTNIRYYEDAGVAISPSAYFMGLTSSKPQVVAMVETGTVGSNYINNYQQIIF